VRAQAVNIIGVCSTSAVIAAGRRDHRRFALPACRAAHDARGTVVDEGDLVAPIPEVKSFGDPKKKYIREIARVCERLYKTSLAALEKEGLPSCSAATIAGRRIGGRPRISCAARANPSGSSGSTRTAT
jgi:hypothetical protein